MKYLFSLGNSPDLAKFEIEQVLNRQQLSFSQDVYFGHRLIIDTVDPLSEAFFNCLGGTVKVSLVFSGSVVTEISRNKKIGDRIIFGASGEVSPQKVKEIKTELEDQGYKVRFVLPQHGETELSSVVVKKQKIAEIFFLTINNTFYTSRTIWVQDFEDWGLRDYGRPAVQAHLGMLPPKVARMMINIGLPVSSNQNPATLMDPYCGVGTILAEALLCRQKVIGSDSDPRQIERTSQNLEWLRKTYSLPETSSRILIADARFVSRKISLKTIDAIVTEPDLGPTDLGRKPYNPIFFNEKLTKLYLDSLSDWKKILKPEGKVVIVLPSFVGPPSSTGGKIDQTIVKNVIDKAKIMGYSFSAGPYEYYRPQAIVRRNICVFTLATST